MNSRPSLLIAGLAVLSATIVGCGGSDSAATSTTTSTSVAEADTEMSTDTESATMSDNESATMSDTESATMSDNESATMSDTTPAADVEPSEELAAEFAAVDAAGFCDGSWISSLEEANANRPTDITELTDAWSCDTEEYSIQVLGWATPDEARANLTTLADAGADAGEDLTTLAVVVKDGHIYAPTSQAAEGSSDIDAATKIAAAVGGDLTTLADFTS